jgi:hypothetical protein
VLLTAQRRSDAFSGSEDESLKDANRDPSRHASEGSSGSQRRTDPDDEVDSDSDSGSAMLGKADGGPRKRSGNGPNRKRRKRHL